MRLLFQIVFSAEQQCPIYHLVGLAKRRVARVSDGQGEGPTGIEPLSV